MSLSEIEDVQAIGDLFTVTLSVYEMTSAVNGVPKGPPIPRKPVLPTGAAGDKTDVSPAMSIISTQTEKYALSSHSHNDDSSID